MTSQQEKRSNSRYTPHRGRPVAVDLNGPDFLEVLEAVNISEGGVGIEVPYGFGNCSIEAPVSVILQLPAPTPGFIVTQGIISHVSGSEFGVSFVELGSQERELLRNYFSSLD